MSDVLVSAGPISLRDVLASDVDTFARWRTQGEWRLFDAPWGEFRESSTEAQQADARKRFSDACVVYSFIPQDLKTHS